MRGVFRGGGALGARPLLWPMAFGLSHLSGRFQLLAVGALNARGGCNLMFTARPAKHKHRAGSMDRSGPRFGSLICGCARWRFFFDDFRNHARWRFLVHMTAGTPRSMPVAKRS